MMQNVQLSELEISLAHLKEGNAWDTWGIYFYFINPPDAWDSWLEATNNKLISECSGVFCRLTFASFVVLTSNKELVLASVLNSARNCAITSFHIGSIKFASDRPLIEQLDDLVLRTADGESGRGVTVRVMS